MRWPFLGWQPLQSRTWKLEVRSRLTAAGQVLRPNDSRRRNLPFVILRGDRPLHLQQRPLSSDGPQEVSSDSYPPRRPDLRDPLQPVDLIRAMAGLQRVRSLAKDSFLAAHSKIGFTAGDSRRWPTADQTALERPLKRLGVHGHKPPIRAECSD
jgi:hypothetical protein